jgi:hypothetical protein
MWVYSDYLQIVCEVKERNRFFIVLNEIRKIARLSRNKEMPSELADQFELILRKCDDALKSNHTK